jgi:hypothetical protein
LTGSEYDDNINVDKGQHKLIPYSFKVTANGEISFRWGVVTTATVLFVDGRPVAGSAVYSREV